MLERKHEYSKNSDDIATTNQNPGAYCNWINTQSPSIEQKNNGKRFDFRVE